MEIFYEVFFTLALLFAPPGATTMSANVERVDTMTFVRTTTPWWSSTTKNGGSAMTFKRDDDTVYRKGPRGERTLAVSSIVPKGFNPATAKTLKLKGMTLTIVRGRQGAVSLVAPKKKAPMIQFQYTFPKKSPVKRPTP